MLFTHVLAPNCIATLLEYSGSGMAVTVLCRDHEYTATYSSIVNLQMLREKECQQNGIQSWKWVCRCAWHLKAQWKVTLFYSTACDDIMYAIEYLPTVFAYLHGKQSVFLFILPLDDDIIIIDKNSQNMIMFPIVHSVYSKIKLHFLI